MDNTWKEDEKIEVVLQPIKKLVIFHCVELSSDEFFKKIQFILMSGHPLAINWAEGVVFLPLPYQPESDRIIEEMLQNGTTYWANVMCALMPEYRPINKMGAREIPIIDQTSDPYFRQVAQWLKKRIETRNPVAEKTN